MNRIFALMYQEDILKRLSRHCLVSINREGLMERIKDANPNDEWRCYIDEYKIPGKLFEGTIRDAKVWIETNVPPAKTIR